MDIITIWWVSFVCLFVFGMAMEYLHPEDTGDMPDTPANRALRAAAKLSALPTGRPATTYELEALAAD